MTDIILNNKKRLFISAVLFFLAFGYVFLLKNKPQAMEEKGNEKKDIAVTTKSAIDLKSASGFVSFPATVVGKDEVKVSALAGGTATAVNFDLGDRVSSGKLLVKIDDQGAGDQLQKALEIAKEQYDLAKENNEGSKKTDATKSAKDIAKLQVQNAQIAIENATGIHSATAPITGTITGRFVSQGDTVSAGQTLATISKTSEVKIQFFVDKEIFQNMAVGQSLKVFDDGKEIAAKIENISSQADQATRRFLIEAAPESGSDLISGTIVSVRIEKKLSAEDENSVLLPLSSISITPNENYIFIAKDGQAKKIPVEVKKISGETAGVKVELSDNDEIIIDGNKLVQDGQKVESGKN